MSYYILIWLWHIRKMEWQASVNVYNKISDSEFWPPMKDPDMSYCMAELAEGLLLLMVEKINTNDMDRLPKLHKFVKYVMGIVRNLSKIMLIVRSRYYLLKAYYFSILKNKSEPKRLLKKAEEHAMNFCNFFESDWIKHNEKAWSEWPLSAINDKWLRSAQTEKVISEWDDFDRKELPMFTLRLPTVYACPAD